MTTLEAVKIKMPFGHYKDDPLGAIAVTDPLYLDWLAGQNLQDTYLVEAVGALVEAYSETIAKKKAAGEKPKLFAAGTSQAPAQRPVQMKLF